MRRVMLFAITVLTSCTATPPSSVATRAMVMPDALPAMKSFNAQRADAPARSNAEMERDFLDLVFRMESGRPIPFMTRFEEPISVRVTGDVTPTLVPDLRVLLDRLRSEAGIDIFMTGAPDAKITIQVISSEELHRAVPNAACFVVPRVSSWAEYKAARGTGSVDWTTLTRRDHAAVFIPGDVSPQEIRDCLHEELAQGLGPLNDLYRLPDSVYNDDNINAVLTGFDMLTLRAYYSPELHNGMTRAEVAARLPALFARLNPRGEAIGARPVLENGRDWIDAVETAMSSGSMPARRRQAAETAVQIARSNHLAGAREGFAYYAYGRLQVGYDQDGALDAFRAADRAYRQSPLTELHVAHVAVQLAAFALRAGDADALLRITTEAIPIARRHENASLLATLMMFQAEALDIAGRGTEAQAVRLDSLGWARYGFGSEQNVRARLREIAALNPLKQG